MLKQILQRLSSETPKFFKTLRKWALTIASLSGATLASGLTIPDTLNNILLKIGIIAGIVVAFTASLTTIWGIEENSETEK